MKRKTQIKNKIIGLLLCMLMIAMALPVVGAMNVQNRVPTASGLIGIKITAKVYDVDDPYNLLGGIIHMNDTITGKYVYDSGIPDSNPNTAIGEYLFTSSSCKFEVFAGGLTFKSNPSNMNLGILVKNNLIGSMDEYTIMSLNNLQLDNGMLVSLIQWDLQDFNGTALDSDALPPTAPVLEEWESNSLLLFGKDPDAQTKTYQILAHVTSAIKGTVVDIQGTFDQTPAMTFPNHYTFNSMHLWTRLVERFPKAFPLLRQRLDF